MVSLNRTSTMMLCLLFVLVGFGVSAHAATYYVATTGNDARACNVTTSPATPKRTINGAHACVAPGDTVSVAPGTYTSSVLTRRHGTSAARIRYVSPTKWGAKIQTSGARHTWTNHGNYVTIEGFQITGDSKIGILNYASHSRILNNYVHHLGRADCGDYGTGDMGTGINHGGSGTPRDATNNNTIGNVLHDLSMHCPIVAGRAGQHGIYHAYGSGIIANNIVYRAQAYAFHLYKYPHDVKVYHNLAFNNRHGIVLGASGSPGPLFNISVWNNIIFDNLVYGMREMSGIGANITYRNNIVFGNGSDVSLTSATVNTIRQNPQFVSYNENGGGNYRLRSTSPGVNAGVTVPEVTTDLDGNNRPSGAYDIGPYERR